MPDDDESDDVEELERIFVVERRADAELTDDELARRRGTKRFALWALAVVGVVVAVAITLVALLVHEGSSGPGSPRAAAQVWAAALARHDLQALAGVECTRLKVANTLPLPGRGSADVGPAEPSGHLRWRVRVTFVRGTGQAPTSLSLQVDVVRRGGRYLVC